MERPGESYSPIGSAYDGRRAAASIDRFLQGASLTASRADDRRPAPASTSTSPRTRPSRPSSPPRRTPATARDEAMAEAARCFPCRCMECVKACEYLKHYGSYPKRYVRDIYNNISIVMGNRKANRMIDSCTLCGLCDTLVPERPQHGRGVPRSAPRHGRQRPHARLASRFRPARHGAQPLGRGCLRPPPAGPHRQRRRLLPRLPAIGLVALARRARLRASARRRSPAASA